MIKPDTIARKLCTDPELSDFDVNAPKGEKQQLVAELYLAWDRARLAEERLEALALEHTSAFKKLHNELNTQRVMASAQYRILALIDRILRQAVEYTVNRRIRLLESVEKVG